MAKGKQTCKILKEIRRQIAAENDINLVIEECTYKGDCLGTCPKCEAEVRYLERELEKRQRLGKVAVVAGMSLSTMLAATSCHTNKSLSKKEPIAGDVVAVAPDVPEVAKDTIPQLEGIVRLLRIDYPFDDVVYEQSMKNLFVFPEMNNLFIRGGKIQYEHIGGGDAYTTFEKLIEATKEFRAPYYPEGEQKLLENLSFYLSDYKKGTKNYNGEMEVVFTVDQSGKLSDIEIQKGIDETLDAEVVSFFEPMKWEPAYYQLKDESRDWPFECRCVMQIQFPIRYAETLMGIVPMYNPVLLHLDSVSPEVQAKMVFPESKRLTVNGYELQIPESLYSTYKEYKEPYLVEKAVRIAAPHYLGGEPAMLQFLEEYLGEDARKGSREIEVEFIVSVSGRLHNVEVVRGIDEKLDDQVTRIFKMMEWEPGVWEMESGEQIMVTCSCTQKIYFPLKQ